MVYIQTKPMMRSKNKQPNTIGITVSTAMIWFTRGPPGRIYVAAACLGLGLKTQLSGSAVPSIAQRCRVPQAWLATHRINPAA